MPGVHPPANEYLFTQLAAMQRQLHALATQQNWGIVDSKAGTKQVIRAGLQPDQTFGIWMLDPTTGNPVAKMTGTAFQLLTSAGGALIDLTDSGLALYSAAGKLLVDLTDTGLAVYDATGHELVKLDDTGQTVYNAAGTEEVKLGDIGTGVYGLAVRNPAGHMQQVAGHAIGSVLGPLTYSSTTWGALSGAPSVSVTCGPSGLLDVCLGAVVKPGSHTTGESAYLAVSISPAVGGSTGPFQPELRAEAGANSNQRFTCYSEFQSTGLTPGTTYTVGVMASVTTSGVVATFTQVTLKATPV